MKICIIKDCENKTYKRKLCPKHNSSEWRKKNPERMRKQGLKDYYKNREKILKRNKTPEVRKQKLEWHHKHKNRRKEIIKLHNQKRINSMYGISLDDYNKLLKKQKEKCEICILHQTNFKKRLSIDHCHKTNKVRGLLCINCNTALGMIKENVNILKSMIKYIRKYQKRNNK